MDGLKKRLNGSIQLKLSFTLAVTILFVAVVAGVFSFLSAFHEAHELQDDVLRQVGQLVDRQRLSPPSLATDTHLKDGNEESRVIVQRLGDPPQSTVEVDDGGPLPLPATLADGMHTLDLSGEVFRVLVKTTMAGEHIAVAQESGFRNEIARHSALRTVMPFLILVPVLLLIVMDLVRKMFRPIAVLAKEIDQRAEQALHPIEVSHLPAEVRPFVVAINRLLARISEAMDTQRRFIADAAHELRSPLTALSLQAERLAESEMSGQARERLATLRQGIERGCNLLDQLLALAKAQSVIEPPRSPVPVQAIFRRVLEDLMPLAERKRIDIGVEGAQDIQVWVSELDMIAVVRNLVDNAIRYSPEGGRVDLSVSEEEGRAVVKIQDSGPGIEVIERERVFDRFYRTVGSEQVGSGLGLSIVRAICDRIGAEIRLGFSDEVSARGLRVCVFMPLTKPSQMPGLDSP